MSGEHILVVDDDPKVRTLLRRCFEGEGFGVSEAKDEQIIVAPTLVKLLPAPSRRLIGNLSEEESVLAGLGLSYGSRAS